MAISESLQRFTRADSSPFVFMNQIRSGAAVANNFGANTSATVGRLGTTPRNRAVIVLNTSDNAGQIEDHIMNLVRLSAATGFNMGVWAIVDQVMDLEQGTGLGTATGDGVTYLTVDGSTLWNTVGADTTGAGTDPGHNVDNSVYGTIAIPSSTTGNLAITGIDAVINLARKKSIELGWTRIAFLLAAEDEAGLATNTNVGFNNTLSVTPPSTSFTLAPTPLDGWVFLAPPALCLPSESAIDIRLMSGSLDWANTDPVVFEAEYSSDAADLPAGAAATGGAVSADVATTGVEVLGTKHYLTMDDTNELTAVKTYNYRVTVSIMGILYWTPTWFAPLLVAEGVGFRYTRFTDDHNRAAKANANGYTLTSIDDGAAAIIVQNATHDRTRTVAVASTTIDEILRFCLCGGDCMDFGQYTSFNMFPQLTDYSGLPDSGTSTYALSEADCEQAVGSWFVDSHFPVEYIPILLCDGNHKPYHSWFYAANNTGINNAAGWMDNVLNAYRLRPHTTGYRDYDDDGDAVGDYKFDCGDTTFIVVNCGIDATITLTGDEETGVDPLPFTANAETAWIKSASKKTKILGWIAAGRTHLNINKHTALGDCDLSTPPPQYYDRSDYKYIFGGWWGAEIVPAITAAYENYCLECVHHDHCHDNFKDLGIQVVWLATPGEVGANAAANGGPYGPGFVRYTGSVASMLHSTLFGGLANRLDNAGWYLCTNTLAKQRIQYITTRVSTIDSGTEFNSDGGLAGITDGSVVRTIDVPLLGGNFTLKDQDDNVLFGPFKLNAGETKSLDLGLRIAPGKQVKLVSDDAAGTINLKYHKRKG